ncbi:hypothetical protein PR001_g298 [Phytophthora rubi]|uniref:Potassium channel domain-containing protein n=1 Tax=Phytophthora rubi TaxID=129364 RepID=A0A6A3NQM2_9STRA|nr:hypothetical protein PR002_g856 [Phytophthora rubi]KAE9052642.1 hypothetical protein PR001_g298 [Phytophthora rubi]
MPSRNEIVPLDASAMESSERPGPGAVTVPNPQKPKATFSSSSSKARATSAEMASVQEQRMTLVRAQRRHTSFQLFYGFFGLALMMVQMEYLWLANTQTLPESCPLESTTQCPQCFEALGASVPVQEGRMILLALRILISFSTALLLHYVYLYYAAECQVMKLKNIMPPKATLLSSSLRRVLLLEMAVLAVHPFPGIEDVDPKWPQLTVATSLVMFTRVALVVRAVQFRNSFNSSNGWFIGALTNVNFTATFFLKSTLKNHPTSCLMASFGALGFVAGYALYVAERFFCAFKRDSCCQPMALDDALWMLIITILTIGYGDVVPRTTLGRAVAVCAGVFGTLSTAVTIAVMSNYLVLTRSEHKVNAFLKKDENRRLINDHAARALQAFVQLRAAQRRHSGLSSRDKAENGSVSVTTTEVPVESKGNNPTGTNSTKRALRRAELKLFTVLGKYRQVKRRVHSHDVSDPMDSQMTMLEMMEVNVEYIRTKIEELSELFLAQTADRSRSKRKLSNMMAAAAIPESPTEVAHANGGGSLSLPPTSSPLALMQQLQLQPNQLQRSPPRAQQQSYQLRQHVPTMSTLQENERSGSSNSLNEAASILGSSAAPTSPENVPTWALVLELTLQSLLEQVSRVSDEVEAVKTRMATQNEILESRVLSLEKRLVVADALHEMSMSRGSARNLLRRGSKSSDDGSNAGSASSPPRLRRGSTVTIHRPSIHNFVTPSELSEYQKATEEQGEG